MSAILGMLSLSGRIARKQEAVAVARKLLDHAKTEYRTFRGVVEDMEPDEP